ncbi:MAG: nucleotidyltransferase domain-containing protein [Myxococcota bacterium]
MVTTARTAEAVTYRPSPALPSLPKIGNEPAGSTSCSESALVFRMGHPEGARRQVPALVLDVLGRFSATLKERFGSELLDVRLFGSYARGQAHEGSDVDVFVLLENVDPAAKRRVLDLAGDLWAETGLFLSPAVFGRTLYETWLRQERPLVMDVMREGVPV